MAAISSTAPSIASSLAQLISGGFGGLPAPADSPSATSQDDAGPASFVTLSEQAKEAAAARAEAEQAAADQLQAFVEAHRVTLGGDGNQASNADRLQNLLGASTPSTGAQPSSGTKVEAIVAQIKLEAGSDQPPPFQTFTPTKSLSNSVTIDGFTLSLSTNASTQYYGVEVSGNGVQAYNKHFGPSAGVGGTDAVPPGVSVGSETVGNNQAIEAITITQNVATASSASVTSAGGSASASEVNASSSSITFLVNYATGQISVQESALSVSARATQTSTPGSTLSTFA
jgi:hypothetical protein